MKIFSFLKTTATAPETQSAPRSEREQGVITPASLIQMLVFAAILGVVALAQQPEEPDIPAPQAAQENSLPADPFAHEPSATGGGSGYRVGTPGRVTQPPIRTGVICEGYQVLVPIGTKIKRKYTCKGTVGVGGEPQCGECLNRLGPYTCDHHYEYYKDCCNELTCGKNKTESGDPDDQRQNRHPIKDPRHPRFRYPIQPN